MTTKVFLQNLIDGNNFKEITLEGDTLKDTLKTLSFLDEFQSKELSLYDGDGGDLTTTTKADFTDNVVLKSVSLKKGKVTFEVTRESMV